MVGIGGNWKEELGIHCGMNNLLYLRGTDCGHGRYFEIAVQMQIMNSLYMKNVLKKVDEGKMYMYMYIQIYVYTNVYVYTNSYL